MPALHRLFYVSRALIDPCGPDPRHILEVGTARNAALGLTGLLSFSGDHFAQVLEGPPQALRTVMDAIRRDPRHLMLREWPAEPADGDRWFTGWSLAYLYDERLEDLIAGPLAHPGPLPPYDAIVRQLCASSNQFVAGGKA